MEKKYLKAIECLAEIIMKQEDELKYKNYEIENLKAQIKVLDAELMHDGFQKENKPKK